MKKKVLAIALVTAFTGMGVAQAADVTAQAVATWSATAKKDTTSKLVVTPLGSLAFQYAEGIKGFNSQIRILDKIEKQEYQESKIEGKHNILQLCQTAISLIKCSSHKDLLPEFEFVKKFIEILYANTNDMTFARYPVDSKKQPHFYVQKEENITIDLDVLRIWVCKVFEILDGCTGFVDFQIDQIKDWLYEMQQAYGE